MAQLTKEYFDGVLKGLATKKDLEKLVTKDDLAGLEQGLDQKLGELEERLNSRLEAIHHMLDVRHRVEKLEQQVAELKLQLPQR